MVYRFSLVVEFSGSYVCNSPEELKNYLDMLRVPETNNLKYVPKSLILKSVVDEKENPVNIRLTQITKWNG